MNEIVNKFLLAGDKFMPEMHLRQPGFSYSSCGSFGKSKERIQKFKETGDSRYIYQNKLEKTCFQHDMAYGDFKDLTRRTASDKILCDKAFNIAKNPKYDGYPRGLASMVYKFLSKFNKGFRFLLCVIDIYSKYAWVIPLKNKKGIAITNPFQTFLKESSRKPNKIWIDKKSKFYNRSMQS